MRLAERIVTCAKLGQDLPGLHKPPFPGPLGQRIYDSVSARAWDMWQEHSARLMSEKTLSMADAGHRKLLRQEMEDFFFGAGAVKPEAFAGRRMVQCVKFGRSLPGLEKPPFPGPLGQRIGQRIFENVSEQGWKLWQDQQTIIMNHYGLALADPEARKFLREQLEAFFFGEGAQLPADWAPPTAKGGKGGGASAPRK